MTVLPPFEVHRPESFEAATALLDELGDDAVVYAGGTELVLLMKLGFAEYAHLVDVKGIPELGRLEAENGTLVVGGGVTHRRLERSELVAGRWPALAEMERGVANLRVRGVGTLGGNLAFSDPHSDPATFLLAAGADVVLRRGGERRAMPLGEFVLGPYQTALAPGELLAEVRIPDPPAGAGVAHRKIAFKERPAATVTCLVRLEGGAVDEARVAIGSVGLVPARAPGAEAALVGRAPDAAALAEAAAAAADDADPVEDANGAVDYKRSLVRALVERTMREAVRRAGGG
jgi:aerobic carbon-monoxide dehydrogenase medium subunit